MQQAGAKMNEFGNAFKSKPNLQLQNDDKVFQTVEEYRDELD